MLIREAVRGDLPAILGLFADDVLGRDRDQPIVDDQYVSAFEAIDNDPRNHLVVVEDEGQVIACLQITYIPGLARHGAERSLLENVHVWSGRRGEGVGKTLITWAVDQARQRGCAIVQLTSDKSRLDAHRFYERLGFVATHEGMKLVF